MECCFCEKSQYVRKSDYTLNLRIKTPRNDVWQTKGPSYDKHFRMPGNNFNDHTKLTIIKQVKNGSLSKSKICSLLNKQKIFGF